MKNLLNAYELYTYTKNKKKICIILDALEKLEFTQWKNICFQ